MDTLFDDDAVERLANAGIPDGSPVWESRLSANFHTLYVDHLYANTLVIADEDPGRIRIRAFGAPTPLLNELKQYRLKTGVFYVNGTLPIRPVVQSAKASQIRRTTTVRGNGNIVSAGDIHVSNGSVTVEEEVVNDNEFDFSPRRAITLVVNVPKGTKLWGWELFGPLVTKGSFGGVWRNSGNGETRILPL